MRLKNLLIKYDTIYIHDALSQAVTLNNLADITDLLSNGAFGDEKNSEGKTALYLAMEMGNVAAVSLLLGNKNAREPMYDYPIIFSLLRSVSPLNINALKKISFIHAVYAAKLELDFYKLLPPNSKEIFEKLSPPLKAIVYKRMFKKEHLDELKHLFQILSLTPQERPELFKMGEMSLGDSQIISNILNICSKFRHYLANENNIYLIDKKVISWELINAMGEYSGYKSYTWDNYQILKQINPELVNFNDLNPLIPDDVKLACEILNRMDVFVTEDCQNLLKVSKLSVKELQSLKNPNGFSIELNSNNVKYLSELSTVIDKESIKKIKQIEKLLTKNGIEALRQNLLTIEEINQFDIPEFSNSDPLQFMLSDNGLVCLREERLTAQDAILISKVIDNRARFYKSNNLQQLLTNEGTKALKEEIISIEDAKKYFLTYINMKGAVETLKEKLITIEALSQFESYDPVARLLSEPGLQALREKLFSCEELLSTGQAKNLWLLLNPIGLQALRKGLITLEQASNVHDLKLLLDIKNPSIIEAMELKLISPSDFYPEGKYADGISELTTQYLIADYKNCPLPNPEAPFKNVIAIQSQCRRYFAQCKFNLFKGVNQLLQSGKVNINNLHQVNDILSLTESGNLVKAEEQHSKLNIM